MTLTIGRRGLLRAGVAAGALGTLRGLAFAAEPAPEAGLLVHVFLAGGMDGLNFLCPADDRDFLAMRAAGLRVPTQGERQGHRLDASNAVDFRLHWEAAPLAEIWRAGRMAAWPACGVPQPTRSHFEAQAVMGWGQGRSTEPTDGRAWLAAWAEAAAARAGNTAPVISLSGQDTTAPALVGTRRGLSLLSLDGGLEVPGGGFGEAMLEALHAGAAGPAGEAGREALAGIRSIARQLPREPGGRVLPYQPAGGANYAPLGGFGRGLATIAQMAKLNPALTAASLVLGGWDTHAGQEGPFAQGVGLLARGLAAFDADMQGLTRRWTVLVASEFGRRLRNNRSGGTDHGRAGTVFAFGGGGSRPFGQARHFGAWPGLRPEVLEDGADLRVATDYREAFRMVTAELAPQAPAPFARA